MQPIPRKLSDQSSGISLACRIQQGGSGAWQEMVELYGPLVDSWAKRYGVQDAPSRQDIVQEVFLSVHRSIDKFDANHPNATFRGWLWRITRNAFLQSQRKVAPHAYGGSTALIRMAEVADPIDDDCEPPGSAADTASLLGRAMDQI